jgi:type IV pilus assembly protein PilM
LRFRSPASRLLAIDLGASHTACAWFRVRGDDVPALIDLKIERFDPDPMRETHWLADVETSLRRSLGRRQFTASCVVALPAHLTQTKFLRVPALAGADRSKLVAFEAQQQLPYRLERAVWAYSVLEDRGQELEVLLIAATRELLESVCGMLARLRLAPDLVLPSSLALGRAPVSGDDETVWRVEIGARSTQMLIGSGPPASVRSSAIAGNSLTQAIGDQLNLGFGAAEALKLRVLGEDRRPPTELNAREVVERCVDAFIGQLQGELIRARLSHLGQGGREPSFLQLSGAASRIRDLDTRLAERIRLPVLRAPSPVGASTREADVLLPLYGLVAATRAGDKARLNLLPLAVARRRDFRRREPWLIAAALLVAIGLSSPTAHYTHAAGAARAELAAVEAELRRIDAQQKHAKAERAALAEAQREFDVLNELAVERSYWIRLLRDLDALVAADETSWLERLQVVPAASSTAPGHPASRTLFGAAPQNPTLSKRSISLKLSGCVLELAVARSESGERLRERVTKLLADLRQIPQVAVVESERFDLSEPGFLRFEAVLTLKPRNAPWGENSLVHQP